MTDRWSEFAEDVESGNPDRVNHVVEEIADIEIRERVRVFDDYFDGLTTIYVHSDDGYVRQSCVRVADRLAPGLPAAVNAQDGLAADVVAENLHGQTDALCGFFLEAMTDDDGRVRQSAERGLTSVCRTYDALDDRETIEALVAELDAMAADHAGKRRDHLLEAKDEAAFTLESEIARVIRGFSNDVERT